MRIYCHLATNGPDAVFDTPSASFRPVKLGSVEKCPICRCNFVNPSDQEYFQRLYKLVHDRSPGRHSFQALHDLSAMYSNGRGVRKDPAKAAELNRKKMLYATDSDSQYSVGGDFLRGSDGFKQDFKKADKYLQLAADQGHADAQYTIGMMAFKGEGMAAPDYAKALTYFKLVS